MTESGCTSTADMLSKGKRQEFAGKEWTPLSESASSGPNAPLGETEPVGEHANLGDTNLQERPHLSFISAAVSRAPINFTRR